MTPPIERSGDLAGPGGTRLLDLELRRGALLLGHAAPAADPDGAPRLRAALAARFPRLGPWRVFPSRRAAVERLVAVARAGRGPEIVRFRGCRHLFGDEPEPDPAATTRRGVVQLGADAPLDALGQRWLRLNDSATVEAYLAHAGSRVAAVLVEPVPLRVNLAVPAPDFLPRLRAACDAAGAWLVADEGASGLRFGAAGSTARLGVEPDAVVLGEAIADGAPFGAFALRTGLDDESADAGPAEPSGGASPIAVAGALAALEATADPGFLPRIDGLGARLAVGLERAAAGTDRPAAVARLGSAVGLTFPRPGIADPTHPGRFDRRRTASLVARAAAGGVYLSPNPMDPLFVCGAHAPADIDAAVRVLREALEAEDDA